MATRQAKLVLGSSRDIPFDKLILSQANVRRVKAGVSVEELAEDIARRGLLTALSVRPVRDETGAETGAFEVPAGGRRYRALERLVKAKRLAKSAPVPCVVKLDDAGISAEDDSLAENVHREALHPLDQFRAFQALAEQGQREEEIAARWFVTPAVVRQRLRLAAVSPRLLDLYAEDALSLEQLMAFTVTADHARQQQVFERIQAGWNKEPYLIRSLLTQSAVDARDRRARYVGMETYEAAGGAVLRDLFTNDGEGWIEDALLLDRLALEKLQAEAAAIEQEGWRWVEVAIDFPYGHQFGLRRLAPLGSGLSPEDEARRDALRAELEQIEADYADLPDDLPEEVDQRLSEIETEIDALDSRPARFDPDEVDRAGVFVSLGSDARIRIERGYVRTEDEPGADRPDNDEADADRSDPRAAGETEHAAPPAGISPPADDDDDGAPRPLPERLLAELSAHRTLALRDAIAGVPDVALTLLLMKLVRDIFGTGYGSGHCLDVSARPAFLQTQAPDLKESVSARAIEARQAEWAELLPLDDEQALWGMLAALDDERRMALLAHCVGASVNALWEKVDRYGGGLSAAGLEVRLRQADRLAGAVQLDMAAVGWRPTVDNYLGRVPKLRILEAVREAQGEMAAQLIDHLKKPDMAREAQRLLADGDWVPEPLRTPAPQAAEDAAPATLPAFLAGAGENPGLAIAAE